MRLLAATGAHRPLLIVRLAHYERYRTTRSAYGVVRLTMSGVTQEQSPLSF